LKTQIIHSIEEVLDIINWWWKEATHKNENQFDDKDAFEASIQASSKNGHAFPVDTNPLVMWNIYYV